MLYEQSLEYQLELRHFDYDGVINDYGRANFDALTVEQVGMLGISLFRLARFEDAELALRYASDHGNQECRIELSGCLLALFKLEEARANAEAQLEVSSGFLRSMAARWLGVLEAIAGNLKYGVSLLRQAYREFQGVGNRRGMQISANFLGGLLVLRTDYGQAERYLKRSLELSNPDHEHAIWIDTGLKLVMLYAYMDRVKDARETLEQMRAYLKRVSPQASKYFTFQIQLCELVMVRLEKNNFKFVTKSLGLIPLLRDKDQRHIEAMFWLGPLLLDSVSRITGQHKLARELIARNLPSTMRPIPMRVVEAVIWSRDRGEMRAVDSLTLTLEDAIRGGHRLDAVRCRLHLAGCLYLVGSPERALPVLREALEEIKIIGRNFLIDDDLKSISAVLIYAQADPEIAALLKRLNAKPTETEAVGIKTFGLIGFSSEKYSGEKWNMEESNVLLILAYMAIRPEHTIDQIAHAVLTEKYLESKETAHTYVRQAIYKLREQFGDWSIVMTQDRRAGPGRYSLHDHFAVVTDFEEAYDALADGDLERLTQLYQGRFVAQSESEFVQEINSEIEGAFYQALLEHLAMANGIEELRQIERYARHLTSVAPDFYEAADLIDLISDRIAEVTSQVDSYAV